MNKVDNLSTITTIKATTIGKVITIVITIVAAIQITTIIITIIVIIFVITIDRTTTAIAVCL